jgi:aspartokinase/homoserine dehydrogenase 1
MDFPTDMDLHPSPSAAAMSSPRQHAHKFGGSSVAGADRYRDVAALLRDAPGPRAVVVSAMQGVTDALTALVHEAAAGVDWQDGWSRLRDRHFAEARTLDPQDAHALIAWLDAEFTALSALLGRIADERPGDALPAHDLAAVQGLGEVWSARLLQVTLGGEAAGWGRLDARDVLVVHPGELGVAVEGRIEPAFKL